MRAVVAFFWTLSLFLGSCGSATISEQTAQAAPADRAPPPDATGASDASPTPASQPAPVAQPAPRPQTAADTEPSEEESLLELVRGNVAVTDLSAVIEIRGARVEGPNGAPAPTVGYVNHVYEVDIVMPIRGCGKTKSFSFAEMAEADIRPMRIGTVLVVSVCRGADGRYFTPDVGYAIPRGDLPEGAVEELAAKPPAKAKSGSACRE